MPHFRPPKITGDYATTLLPGLSRFRYTINIFFDNPVTGGFLSGVFRHSSNVRTILCGMYVPWESRRGVLRIAKVDYYWKNQLGADSTGAAYYRALP